MAELYFLVLLGLGGAVELVLPSELPGDVSVTLVSWIMQCETLKTTLPSG